MSMRTPLGRARGLGSARSGTGHFWLQRVTSVAGIPLTVGFIVVVTMVIGNNHAGAARILGSPGVALVMILFILTIVYHMWLGMQVVIEDYVHGLWRPISLMGNTFFCFVIGLASIYAILKL